MLYIHIYENQICYIYIYTKTKYVIYTHIRKPNMLAYVEKHFCNLSTVIYVERSYSVLKMF